MINLAKAIGRVVVSYKDIQNLAGYTTLVHELEEVLVDLNHGKYKRTMVTQSGETGAIKEEGLKLNEMTNKGTVKGGTESMKFEDVPILTPNGDVLIPKMNFEIKPGMNMMIIDISDIPAANIGDIVTLIGVDGKETVSADSLAGASSTINYEVVTRIQEELPRILLS